MVAAIVAVGVTALIATMRRNVGRHFIANCELA